jgi:hypothetical protein
MLYISLACDLPGGRLVTRWYCSHSDQPTATPIRSPLSLVAQTSHAHKCPHQAQLHINTASITPRHQHNKHYLPATRFPNRASTLSSTPSPTHL